MKKLGCLIILCCLLTGVGLVWSLPPITSNSTGTTSDNATIDSRATQLVTGGTLPSASVGGGNSTIDSSGNALFRTVSYIRDPVNPFCTQYYAGSNYDDNYTEICAPTTGYTKTCRMLLPTAAPTGNQVMVFPVPTAGVSQGTWGTVLTESGTYDIATTGKINGGLDLVGDSDNHTLTATELYGGFVEMTGAGTVIINDNATTKMSFCVFSTGANTVKVRSYKPSDSIILKDGTDLGSGVAAKVTTAGQLGCFVASSVADVWRQISGDTWVTE